MIGWVIRNSNGTIKMASCRHLGNASIIIVECMILTDDILAVKNNGFLSLQIEGDSKIVIDCFNKRINVSYSIRIFMKDIWKLSQ